MTDIQVFHRGDLVRVAKDLGELMSHFTSDVDAVVVGSYADIFTTHARSKDHMKLYKLYIRGHGFSSWYEEHQLTLIEKAPSDPLQMAILALEARGDSE